MMTSLDLIGLAPFALLGLDERRRVNAANPEAQAFLGHSERAMHRKPLSEILFHDSPVFGLIDKAQMLQGDVTAHAIPINGPSLRRQRVLDLRLRPVENGGMVIGANFMRKQRGQQLFFVLEVFVDRGANHTRCARHILHGDLRNRQELKQLHGS